MKILPTSLNDEQSALQDTIESLCADHGRHQAPNSPADSFDHAAWDEFASLGLIGALLPTDSGGSGLGTAEAAIIMEAIGRNLIRLPYLETALLCAPILAQAIQDERGRELLQQIADGSSVWAYSGLEPLAVEDHAQAVVSEADGQWTLRGSKRAIIGGPWASHWLIAAWDWQSGAPQKVLVMVEPTADGVHQTPYLTVDGRAACDASFADVVISKDAVIARGTDADAAESAGIDLATLGICAEAIGLMDGLNEMTLEFVRQRKQFGQTLGSFQVLQHMLVDAHIAQEEAAALVWHLGRSLPLAADNRNLLHATKATINEHGIRVAKNAVQLHGGMGMSDELIVGNYFKRLHAIAFQLGDTLVHEGVLAQTIS